MSITGRVSAARNYCCYATRLVGGLGRVVVTALVPVVHVTTGGQSRGSRDVIVGGCRCCYDTLLVGGLGRVVVTAPVPVVHVTTGGQSHGSLK